MTVRRRLLLPSLFLLPSLALTAAGALAQAGVQGAPRPQAGSLSQGAAAARGTVAQGQTQSPGQRASSGAGGQDPGAVQTVGTLSPAAQQVVQRAEQSYNSGVANYKGNRLDAARMDFDYAVDTMLSSGLDLKGDAALAEEFDRLVSAINTLEMAALRQGNGFSPKLEAAPLETAEDTTFAPNPELVAKLKTELNTSSDLPLVINDQVAGYIGVFSSSSVFRAHFRRSMERAGKYRGMMERVLKEEGVPQDLIYLAVAESGFQPQALNARSGAGGIWQFMPYTGHDYGLTRNGFFDERFDPEKSTRAYARYMKALYAQLGDWYLAMAGFNWGPGAIQRAVQKTGYADFWELYRRNAMPAETRAYVPQILAAVLMAKNPDRYGLTGLVQDRPVVYDTVHTDYAIDLKLVADVTGATVPEIVALNPALLRLQTPRDMGFELHVPTGTKELYANRLKDIPEDRRAVWRFHVVKAGETLESVASSLHARAEDLAEANGITAQDPMSAGDELVVPVQSTASARPQRYTVRRGDTLVAVADRFNISVEDLRSWNRLDRGELRPGHSVYVTEPVRLAPSGRRGRHGGGGSVGGGGRRGRHARGGSGGGTSSKAAHGKGRAVHGGGSRSAGHASSGKRRGRR